MDGRIIRRETFLYVRMNVIIYGIPFFSGFIIVLGSDTFVLVLGRNETQNVKGRFIIKKFLIW